MINFENSLNTAKHQLLAWSSYAKLTEITLVRDAKGQISIYLMPKSKPKIDSDELRAITNTLAKTLGSFFSGTLFIENAEEWTKDLFKKIRELRIEDPNPPATTTSPKWYLIERGIAKKAWIQCSQNENSAWSYESTQPGSKKTLPKIVTFYSYKGGMGRTTALTAVAFELLRQHKNVLMIDTDLEAPGLSTFFFPADDEGLINKGTVDYLQLKNMDKNAVIDMTEYIIPLISPSYIDSDMGKLYLVSGGQLNDEFLLKLARIDTQELNGEKLKALFIQLLKDCCSALESDGGIDYILIDSRAGFHDMAGIVTAQLPHGVVLFGKDSFQSWFGIQQAVRTIATSQTDKPFAIIVDSGCGFNGLVSEEEKDNFRAKSYEIFCTNYYDNDIQPGLNAHGEAHDPIFIRYSATLAGDIPLYDGKKVVELKKQLSDWSYKELTYRIMEQFGENPMGGSELNE